MRAKTSSRAAWWQKAAQLSPKSIQAYCSFTTRVKALTPYLGATPKHIRRFLYKTNFIRTKASYSSKIKNKSEPRFCKIKAISFRLMLFFLPKILRTYEQASLKNPAKLRTSEPQPNFTGSYKNSMGTHVTAAL